MLEQSSTARTYTRDAYAPVRRDAQAEVKKLTAGSIPAPFHFQAFLCALTSAKPAPELEKVDLLFGFLIGSWDIDAVLHDEGGQTQRTRGEVHASWVLEGRAISRLRFLPVVEPALSVGFF